MDSRLASCQHRTVQSDNYRIESWHLYVYDSFDAKSSEMHKEQREEDKPYSDISLKSSSDVLNSSERFYDLKKKEPKDAWSPQPIIETVKKEDTDPLPETKQITEALDTKQISGRRRWFVFCLKRLERDDLF